MRDLMAIPLCGATVALGYASAWLGSLLPQSRRQSLFDRLSDLALRGRP